MNRTLYQYEEPVPVPEPDHTTTTQTENYGTYQKIYEDTYIVILKKHEGGTWS